MDRKTKSLNVSREIHHKLKKAAVVTGMTIGALTEALVTERVEEINKAYEDSQPIPKIAAPPPAPAPDLPATLPAQRGAVMRWMVRMFPALGVA